MTLLISAAGQITNFTKQLASIFAYLSIASASPLGAQIVEGTLLDFQTGEPISGATVLLLDRLGGAVGGTLTGFDGGFRIEAPSTGQYRLRAERIGYQSTTSPPFDIVSGETLQVEMRLAIEAVLLAPLTVTSERMPRVIDERLERWGYYDRKEHYGDEGNGFGQFIERDEIKRYVPFQVTDILQRVRGVRVANESVSMRLGCSPAVFLDGVRWRLGTGRLNDVISVSSIVAIEVYNSFVMPVQYMHFSAPGGNPCGAIAVWTGF